MEYAPVCGCDGVTYGSRCTAFGRGVSYRSVGECDPSPSQQQPEPQPAVPADVSVQQKDSGGKRRGLGWKDISSAFAASAEFLRNKQQPAMEEGLGLASSSAVNGGETTRVRCGSRGLAPCEEGYFCEFVDGLCGETDTGGFCTHRKLACNKIYRPVCGCDGERRMAGGIGDCCLALVLAFGLVGRSLKRYDRL